MEQWNAFVGGKWGFLNQIAIWWLVSETNRPETRDYAVHFLLLSEGCAVTLLLLSRCYRRRFEMADGGSILCTFLLCPGVLLYLRRQCYFCMKIALKELEQEIRACYG